MEIKNINISKLYKDYNDFFNLNGSSIMKPGTEAALNVCKKSFNKELIIWRIEGGIWHNPGFEARLDCIWDGTDPPISNENAKINNKNAYEFLLLEKEIHDVFIITTTNIK